MTVPKLPPAVAAGGKLNVGLSGRHQWHHESGRAAHLRGEGVHLNAQVSSLMLAALAGTSAQTKVKRRATIRAHKLKSAVRQIFGRTCRHAEEAGAREAEVGGVAVSALTCLGLLAACGLITAQYAFLQIFGVYSGALSLALGSAVGGLYEAMNLGACALAFLAGLLFDALGPAGAALVGGSLSSVGLLSAVALLHAGTPASSWGVLAGFLAFGFGSSCLNTVGVLGAVRVVPARHAGKASAGVLCFLALGTSLHAAVYARWFLGDPLTFLLRYQLAYTGLMGVLGFLVFRSPAGQRALRSAAKEDSGSGLEPGQDEKPQGLFARMRSIVCARETPWLAALFMGPLAYSFSLFGVWSTCAEQLAVPLAEQTRIAMGLGIASAFGRVILGGLADAAPRRYRRLGWELCCAAGLLIFHWGFALLEWDQRRHLSLALWAHSVGYGGVLALAPAALRTYFPAKDLGLAYGLLYQCLAVSFTFFNRSAEPVPGCTGPECFQRWFRTAGLVNLVCLLWATSRCLRAVQLGSRDKQKLDGQASGEV